MRTNAAVNRISRVFAISGAALLATVIMVGACSAEVTQTQAASPLGNKDVGKSETAIGSLVADALRSELRTDLAFVAASEMKAKDAPFPAGKVLSSDVEALISYPEDPLAVLELDGKTIRAALERSVTIYPQPNLGFLQVSGLSFTFDGKKPAGARVTSVTVGTSALSDTASYKVAVTNSMANGALGYWKVWDQQKVTLRKADESIATALESYFKSNPQVDYGTLGRITTAK